ERRAAEKAKAEANARASAEREAAEGARAEEAMRRAEEARARREAERKAAQRQPEVQRAPLPPPTDPPPKRVSPFVFEGLLGTQWPGVRLVSPPGERELRRASVTTTSRGISWACAWMVGIRCNS